jgi:hypothetical protein
VIYEKYPEGSLGMENVHNEISDWIEEQFTKAFPGKKIDVSTTQVTIEENGQEVTIPLKCYESIFAVTMSDAQNLGFFYSCKFIGTKLGPTICSVVPSSSCVVSWVKCAPYHMTISLPLIRS